MDHIISKSCAALTFAAIATVSNGYEWVTWAGNGHSYLAVAAPNGISWGDASAQAGAMGGYLATLTSAAENEFVFQLINKPEFWINQNEGPNTFGPWFGLVQAPYSQEPDGGWGWVTGEEFDYRNWNVGEPNNSPNNENAGHFHNNGSDNVTAPTWNDLQQNWYQLPHGYVVEMSEPAVPSPGAFIPMAFGLGIGFIRSRKTSL